MSVAPREYRMRRAKTWGRPAGIDLGRCNGNKNLARRGPEGRGRRERAANGAAATEAARGRAVVAIASARVEARGEVRSASTSRRCSRSPAARSQSSTLTSTRPACWGCSGSNPLRRSRRARRSIPRPGPLGLRVAASSQSADAPPGSSFVDIRRRMPPPPPALNGVRRCEIDYGATLRRLMEACFGPLT